MGFERFQSYTKLKFLCTRIIQKPNDVSNLRDLLQILEECDGQDDLSFVQCIQPTVLSTFYPIIKNISENKTCYTENEKQLIVDVLKALFNKSITEKLNLFFNIYSLLLFEIYDAKVHQVLDIHEEYKLSIMLCMTALAKSVSYELIPELYCKQNAPKLCQMLYVCMELVKHEKLKSLRIAAMECIMTIARVFNDDDFNDIVVRNQIAEVFLFFLPGIASGLRHIALEDEKVGHKIPLVALKTWGRIVTLMMQDYRSCDEKQDMPMINKVFHANSKAVNKLKINEVKEYIQKTSRTPQWYEETDKKIQFIVADFKKLTHHSHPKVRLELACMAGLLIENCIETLPLSLSHLMEILITLSEDEEIEISNQSKAELVKFSAKFSRENMKVLLENLEEGFYNHMTSLPRKFNAVDENEQIAAVNLLNGYILLFGESKLNQVLLSTVHLNRLLSTLIHISEIEKNEVSLLEEYTIQELEVTTDMRTPWKKFVYFRDDRVKKKLEAVCKSLAKFGGLHITSDFLLDVFTYDLDHKKEAIFLLNELCTDIEVNEETMALIKNILFTYTEKKNWDLPLAVMIDEFGYEHNLSEIQDNIIQVCLLVEGIGKIALGLKKDFHVFLLRTLYLVLERAGSAQPLVQAAGLTALSNLTIACGYSDITQLINNNIDYFSYHVERKLRRLEENKTVLDVLAVVMKYSTIDVLESTSDIVKEVLMQSCDKFKEKNANGFLRVFKIFINSLHRWLGIQISIPPLKTKTEKFKEIKDFEVSGVNYNNDFSDNIMEKSAEEMWKEDVEKKQKDIEEEINGPETEEYKKPEPELHIKLTVSILSRSLHFLPSKDRTRKILVLEILNSGVEILKDYEDELLPIVHQIWSPLLNRFKKSEHPVVINFSIQLLSTLARLSRDFIRSRTVKDVLPSIAVILDDLSKESYLKDKGSAYRYTQGYKLQLTILETLGRILVDLDVLEENYIVLKPVVFKYLSDKQPIPLQTAAVEFFKILITYDPNIFARDVEMWEKITENAFVKNVEIILKLFEANKNST